MKELQLRYMTGINAAQRRMFKDHKLTVLSEFKQKTTREAWRVCTQGGFVKVVQEMIASKWKFKDCKTIHVMRAFLDDHLDKLDGVDVRTINALRAHQVTSFTLLQYLTKHDLQRGIPGVFGPSRIIYLKLALEGHGIKLE